jgi:hypothetical protein
LLRPEGLAVAGQEPLGIELLGNLRVVEVLLAQQEHVRRRPLVVLIRELSSGPSSWVSLVAQGRGLSSLPRWSGAVVSTRPAGLLTAKQPFLGHCVGELLDNALDPRFYRTQGQLQRLRRFRVRIPLEVQDFQELAVTGW